MKADDIDVKLEHDGRMIRLSGTKKSKEGEVEIESRFEKAFMLGNNRFETDKITANLVDGVLTITAPKVFEEEVKESKIKVIESAPEESSEPAVSDKETGETAEWKYRQRESSRIVKISWRIGIQMDREKSSEKLE